MEAPGSSLCASDRSAGVRIRLVPVLGARVGAWVLPRSAVSSTVAVREVSSQAAVHTFPQISGGYWLVGIVAALCAYGALRRRNDLAAVSCFAGLCAISLVAILPVSRMLYGMIRRPDSRYRIVFLLNTIVVAFGTYFAARWVPRRVQGSLDSPHWRYFCCQASKRPGSYGQSLLQKPSWKESSIWPTRIKFSSARSLGGLYPVLTRCMVYAGRATF